MLASRRKTSAVLKDFLTEIHRLEEFDSENQIKFTTSLKKRSLSLRQMHLLTEHIFFVAFRSYEGFIRDLFLLYCLEKDHSSRKKVVSYLRPIDFIHGETLIQSSMPFLDWTSPDVVIGRAETYLKNGFPIKLPYQTNLQPLRDFKHIRNHIAHNSKESLEDFKKVVKRHYGTMPLVIPSPGEFLLVTDRANPKKYKLLVFFELMRKIAQQLV
jgi:hypothetical protein